MIVYKVVRNKNGKLKSAMSRNNRFSCRVRREYAQLIYWPGKTTVPKFGKIFAFDNLASAQSFIKFMIISSSEIWEAETSEAEPIHSIEGDSGWGATILCRFKAFWKGELFCSMPAPHGTIVCPELSLRRRCDNAPVKNSP